MFGIDLTIFLVIVIAVIAGLVLFDQIFAGGAMMGAAAQSGAAMMSSPYGWMGIVAIVVIVLAAFGALFGTSR